MWLTVLDSGPLGLVSQSRGTPEAIRCRRWVQALLAAGVRVVVPEIADYEVRRELLRAGATAGLARLDLVKASLHYAPLTTDVMLRAAGLWAEARRQGKPTASPDALDGDVILAAQALMAGGPGDTVIVATGNVGHLGRFVDARTWDEINPPG
jgi:predicted nucleic acid-binding protein